MTLVFEPRAEIGLEALEDELARAFEFLRQGVLNGYAVVVALDEEHVQGTGDVASAALAHGLIGLVRAFALEGRKPGWRVSAVSFPSDIDGRERVEWTERLAESHAGAGALLRLGGEHLGRVTT
jgi:hypothetical protein